MWEKSLNWSEGSTLYIFNQTDTPTDSLLGFQNSFPAVHGAPHEGTADLVIKPFSSFSKKQLITGYLSSLPPHEGTRDLVINTFSSWNDKMTCEVEITALKLFSSILSSLPPHEGTKDLIINPFYSFSKMQLTKR